MHSIARIDRKALGRALRVAFVAWLAVIGMGAAPAAALAVPLPATGTIATVIGLGRYNGDNQPATSATLNNFFGQSLTGIAGHPPGGLAVGPDGSVYISERQGHRVRKVGPDGMITTVAGTGSSGFSGDGGPATRAALNGPAGLAVAGDGTLYIADAGNRRVRKVEPNGTIRTIAGTGVDRGGGNGCPATRASFREPNFVALGPDGSLYITDRSANQVRRLTPDNCIAAFAGAGTTEGGSAGDGEQAQFARFDSPMGVAVAPDGTVYIADRSNHRIRVVDPSGMIFTLAGSGRTGDGPSMTDTRFGEFHPEFTADRSRNCSGQAVPAVRRNGVTVASGCPSSDRDAPNARFDRPIGIALGPDGSIYVGDQNDNLIRRIMTREVTQQVFGIGNGNGELPRLEDAFGRPVRRVITVAGVRQDPRGLQPGAGFDPVDFLYGDAYEEGGPATGAQLRNPSAVAVGPDGALYFLDQGNNRVMKVVNPGPSLKPGQIFRVAGAYNGPSGAPRSTQLMRPRGVAVTPNGDLFVADGQKSAVRWVSPDGTFTDLVAGTGTRGGATDFVLDGQPARQTRLVFPDDVAVGPNGDLYIADRGMHRIFKVANPSNQNGQIFTVAGTGRADFQADVGFSPEGNVATQENLNAPAGVAVAQDGTVYFAEAFNNMIRKVTPDGKIFKVAGTGFFGWNGDNADARSADLHTPQGLALGADGTIFFADTGNTCVRKVTPGGALVTVAGMCGMGTGAPGSGFPMGDGGPATSASMGSSNSALAPVTGGGPEAVAVAPNGDLYIADTYNCRVRKVGADGMITTVVGTGTCGEGGDGGAAAQAQLWGPRGLAFDRAGNLFIADTDNNKIRVVAAG